MFKAVKELNKKQQENLKVEDTNGKLAVNPNDTMNIIASFFKENFQSETATEIEAFTGSPRKLHQPITKEERGDQLANPDRRPRGYRKTQTTLLSSSSKTEKRPGKRRQNHKKTKLKLYKALVKSVLTYNCGTWALAQSQEERLNAFHRKQLKKVLNVKYPVKITNSSLYSKCNEGHLPIFILESRWRLFGHILRRDSQIPANQAMSGYFVTEGSKFKGRPLTTPPVVLNRDPSLIINSNLQLKSSHDLEHLRSIAQQRDEWTKLTARILEAAEVFQNGALRCERP
ncbi:hypothetical protein ElyMa_000114500 [Elysia marginata]|uniref:Uncharacterized protein n=1 Tax=Elysia marginata TaxID=1093978 RepID=A0AAV4ELG4_9GAST|nr:hypothetical protein ElyMa_000114500 [Elysia marginata]